MPSLPTFPRWWIDVGASARAPIDEHGFLYEGEAARWVAPSTTRVELSALDEVPCVVMLGEAGAGKTTELRAIEKRLRSAGADVLRVSLREYGQAHGERGGLELITLTHKPGFTTWRAGKGKLYLLLDGLDECGYTPSKTLRQLREILEGEELTRLSLRLTSRSGAWSEESRKSLVELFGERTTRVLRLLPLRRSDAIAAMTARGVERPDETLRALVKQGLGPLAAHPDTLAMLVEEVEARAEVETLNAVTLRRRAVEHRLKDHTRGWERDVDANALSRLVEAAQWLGAVSVLGAAPVFTDADLAQLEGAQPRLSAGALRVCASTALFERDGERISWSHGSFAEFLAAEWIREGARPPAEQIKWLVGKDGGLDALPGPVAATAGWLAAMDERVAWTLVQDEPTLFLRSDRTSMSTGVRREVVTALLERARKGGDRLREWDVRFALGGLWYDGIDEELAGVIAAKAHDDARDLALDLVDGPKYARSIAAAVEVALDRSEDLVLRRTAAGVVRDYGDDDARRALIPIAREQDPSDIEDGLKAITFDALWRGNGRRELVSIDELAGWITPPNNRGFVGEYHHFLLHLPNTLDGHEATLILNVLLRLPSMPVRLGGTALGRSSNFLQRGPVAHGRAC